MIKKVPLPFLILFFSFFVLIFHLLATKFHLYWLISWSDAISHIFGGIAAILFFWFFFLKIKKNIICSNPRFFTLVFAIFIGVLWECLEIFFNISIPGSPNYIWSTLYDLIFDVFGAFLGYYYFIDSKNGRK